MYTPTNHLLHLYSASQQRLRRAWIFKVLAIDSQSIRIRNGPQHAFHSAQLLSAIEAPRNSTHLLLTIIYPVRQPGLCNIDARLPNTPKLSLPRPPTVSPLSFGCSDPRLDTNTTQRYKPFNQRNGEEKDHQRGRSKAFYDPQIATGDTKSYLEVHSRFRPAHQGLQPQA